MKFFSAKSLAASVLAAFAMAFAAMITASAPADAAKKGYKPLKGTIYYKQRRVGGYSYKYVDAIDTRRFVDRSKKVNFTFEGKTVTALAGDTVACCANSVTPNHF